MASQGSPAQTSSSSAVVTGGGGGSLARSSIKKSIMKKPLPGPLTSDCQYAQLVFDNRQHSSFDDSILYLSSSPHVQRYQGQQTNYATIDHGRRHNKAKIGRQHQKELMHSASCPFKVIYYCATMPLAGGKRRQQSCFYCIWDDDNESSWQTLAHIERLFCATFLLQKYYCIAIIFLQKQLLKSCTSRKY